MLCVEPARQSDWDGIAACHRSEKVTTTWNLNRSTMGSHRLIHQRFTDDSSTHRHTAALVSFSLSVCLSVCLSFSLSLIFVIISSLSSSCELSCCRTSNIIVIIISSFEACTTPSVQRHWSRTASRVMEQQRQYKLLLIFMII